MSTAPIVPPIPNPTEGLTRREFVSVAASQLVALYFGVRGGRLVHGLSAVSRAALPPLAPNQWISIASDNTVTIRAAKTEMGQGVRTSLPAIVAAELGADWASVRVVHAEPGQDFPEMGTSGSDSIESSWLILRKAAASARALLTTAAASRWHVAESECTAQNGAIRHASSGRNATFGDLISDAASLPLPKEPALRPDAELMLLGTRLPKVDTPAIVLGHATYGIDVRVPGMRFAVLERPPVPGATVARQNETAARAVSGVLDVVRTPSGVAIVATSSWAAIAGREALAVEWSNADRPEGDSQHYIDTLIAALPHGTVARREGDPTLASTATRTLDATYVMPFQAHAALEPLACVADARVDRCEIWVGTQRPNGVKALAAKTLGLPENQVTVHVMLTGGAFGRRIGTDHAREAIELSAAIRAPVQVLWTREDDFAHDWYQAAQVNRIAASLDASGNIVSWRQQTAEYHLSMFGAYQPNADPAAEANPWGGFDNPYVFPHMEVMYHEVESPVQTGAWRSVSYPGGAFARESFIDEIAAASNRDPLDLRLALLARPLHEPARRNAARTATRLANVLTMAADAAAWRKPFSAVRDGRRWGRGLACNPYESGAMVAQIAEVSVGDAGDVRVHRVTTAIDAGRVIDRAGLEAQVQGGVIWALSATLKTKITFTNGRANQQNFDDFAPLRMAEAPQQTVIIVDSAIGPFGAGEAPVPAVYAAVASAVAAATGQRIRETPLHVVAGVR